MKTLCAFRELYRAMAQYEQDFYSTHGLNLNEGMLLCTIADQNLTASDLAGKNELSCSNCSKVIKSLEDKGFIERALGKEDKRQMFFSLSENGKFQLKKLKSDAIQIPEILQPFIDNYK